MSRPIREIAVLCLACTLRAGSSKPAYTVETAAGSYFVGDGGLALEASLSQPEGIVRDAGRNLIVADADDHRIRRISPSGLIETIAGDGQAGFSGDGGPARLARVNHPYGLAIDRSGALFIADLGNARVRRIGPDGTITTVAGGGSVDPSAGDGSPAALIRLTTPRNVAVDGEGNLYISDFDSHRVYRIDGRGTFTTIAGTGEPGASGDGAAGYAARLFHPAGLAVDYSGTIYIADSGNRRVRRLVGHTIFPWGGILDSQPTGLAVDGGGNLFIGNSEGGTVMRISLMGGMTALPLAAGEVWAEDGSLFFTGDSRVSRLDLTTRTRTDLAGPGGFHFSGDRCPAPLARLHGPYALAAGNAGDFFIADLLNRRVRRVDAAGQITTVAGDGTSGMLDEVAGLATDASGTLWIADRASHRLWKLGQDGFLTLAAGTGNPLFGGDNGPAAAASLNAPHALVFDRSGDLLIADTGNGRIRKISPDGRIDTLVGGLSEPRGLALGASGDLYIAETAAGRILRLRPDGALETVATGLRTPRGVSVSSDGTVYVSESGADRVIRLGDGGAAIAVGENAGLLSPMDVLALPDGSLLVADFGHDLVLKLVPQAADLTQLPPLHILHAATNAEGPVAPGEIVSIYGAGFVGGCTVLAGETPAWLLYVGERQINAVLPDQLQPEGSVAIRAVCGGNAVGEASVTVTPANPGLFANTGRIAALNQDGTVNTSANPATPGSIVSLFGTGLGTAQTASALIGGFDAPVLYAGPAPGLPGVFQVNTRVPVSVPAGDIEVRVSANGFMSPPGTLLAVR